MKLHIVLIIMITGCTKLTTICAQWRPFIDQECRNDAYPPKRLYADNFSPSYLLHETYAINLDLPPEQRWSHVVGPRREELCLVIETFKQIIPFESLRLALFYLIDKQLPHFLTWLPAEYGREIRGIANATGIELGEVIFVNIFYEFSSLCTSILARTSGGNDSAVVHGRNLDFGMYPFVGWNANNHTWKMTERLKPLTVNCEFYRNRKLVFKTVQFAGYVGVITGVRPQAFSLSLNTRFDRTGWFSMLRWFTSRSGLFVQSTQKQQQPTWLGFATRDVLQNARTFQEARKKLKSAELLASVYFIIGGHGPANTNNSDGCIITRSPTAVEDERCLSTSNVSFLVQTNDDWWRAPKTLDNRRTPALECMEDISENRTTIEKLKENMYNVLSTKPVLNKLTVYTSLMLPREGLLESYERACADPCWPW